MSAPEFSFTPNANPVVELGLGDTRVPTGTGVWDSALWDDASAVWQGTEPAWWDVSCFAVEAEIARGRERATDRFAPGVAGVVLNNEDGWADMAGDPGTIAAVSLRPGRAIRIGIDVHSIGVVWLFRGIIDKVTPSYDPVHVDNVKLDCIDLLGEVGHVKLVESAPVGGDDTTVQRINRILDVCHHPAEKRILNPDTIYPVKLIQTSYGALAVDLLGQAADSAGGVVYGDELGNIVYRPYGWQNYQAGPPNGGAIGNVVAGTPGTPAFTPDPYLDTTGAPVTTPDAPSVTLPGAFTVFATVRHSTGGTGTSFLAGQWASGQREWKVQRDRANGRWSLVTSADGTASTIAAFTGRDTPTTGTDETWALSVLLNDGAGHSVLQAYRRNGGDDINPLWFSADAAQVVPALPWANRTSAVSVGDASGLSGQTWPGRIYDVELTAASMPTPKGTTVWHFDVGDTTAGTTSWTDGNGRVWTVGGAASGHTHPPTIPAIPGLPGDVCPAGWEVSYDRMDIATKVELNRQLPEPVPRMRYTLDTATTGAVVAGHARFNNTDQQAAISLVVNTVTGDGTNVEGFLRNLVPGAEIDLSDVGDVSNNTRQYVVTTKATGPWDDGAGGRYYDATIAWTDGLTAIGGTIDMTVAFVPPTPYVVDDIAGQTLYGTEVFELTDLISTDGVLFDLLAQRALATRGYKAMPRLEAVTLDAKASRGDMVALEMMAQCRPELPSRYLCRLRMEDGRIVFDRNMFAVGTRHFIARDEWTLRISLDDAAWASTPYGKIAARESGDVAALAGTVTTPSNFGPVSVTEANDAAAIVGSVANFVGVIARTEADDVAAVAATFTPLNVLGVISRSEANDVAAITGAVS